MVLEDTTLHTWHSHTAGRLTLHYLAGVPRKPHSAPHSSPSYRIDT